MSDPSSGITFPIVQEAMPACHISTDLVRGMPTAMPPPAGASHARRRERLTRVIDEVASVSGGVRGAVAINPLQLSPAAAGAAATRGAKRATTLYAARRRGLEWWWERRWRPRWVRRQGSAWVTVPGRRLDRVGWWMPRNAGRGIKRAIRATTLYAAQGAKLGSRATTLYAAPRWGLG